MRGRKVPSITYALACALVTISLWTPAQASLPVPFAMVGCIRDGGFATSNDLRSPQFESTELRALEGKTIRVEGALSPYDFRAGALYVVSDSCREELFNAYFLCDPCQTQFSQPPGKASPAREGGSEVSMSKNALEELTNLNTRLKPASGR